MNFFEVLFANCGNLQRFWSEQHMHSGPHYPAIVLNVCPCPCLMPTPRSTLSAAIIVHYRIQSAQGPVSRFQALTGKADHRAESVTLEHMLRYPQCYPLLKYLDSSLPGARPGLPYKHRTCYSIVLAGLARDGLRPSCITATLP